jgi:YVTN family beta-propeller protein
MLRLLFAALTLSLLAGCGSTDVTDDLLPTVAFEQATASAVEGEAPATVTVRLAGAAAEAVSVEVALDAEASSASPSDIDGFDSATVTFPAGSASGATETLALSTTPDEALEGDETAVFVLRNPSGATLGMPDELTLTISEGFDPSLVDYDAIATPDFGDHVQPLLAARCGDCHGGDDPAAGLVATTWEGLVAGSDFGDALIAYDPDNSLMIELMTKLPEDHPAFEAHQLREAEVAFLRRWIEQGARDDDGEVPNADAGAGKLYVCNQAAGQVAIIDVENLVVSRYVSFADYGGPMQTNPHHTAVEPDGSAWYVTLINGHRVLKYDASTNEVIDEAELDPTFFPGMLAINPQSGLLFAGRSFADATGGRSIYSIQRDGMEATEVQISYTRPHPIAITADGNYLLSGSLADNIIASYDIQVPEPELVDLIEVEGEPKAFVHYAVSPDGGVAALTSQLSQELYFIDVSDPENLQILSVVEVGEQPWHPVYSPDGTTVYVPNRLSHSVSVVDASDPATPTVTATIADPSFSMPHGSAITDDGRRLFVSNRNLEGDYTPRYPLGDNEVIGTVSVIDTETNEVIKVIETEEYASGMAIYQP